MLFRSKYVGDVEEGPVALEDVHDTVQADVQKENEDATYNKAVEDWVAATKVTKDLKSLND